MPELEKQIEMSEYQKRSLEFDLQRLNTSPAQIEKILQEYVDTEWMNLASNSDRDDEDGHFAFRKIIEQHLPPETKKAYEEVANRLIIKYLSENPPEIKGVSMLTCLLDTQFKVDRSTILRAIDLLRKEIAEKPLADCHSQDFATYGDYSKYYYHKYYTYDIGETRLLGLLMQNQEDCSKEETTDLEKFWREKMSSAKCISRVEGAFWGLVSLDKERIREWYTLFLEYAKEESEWSRKFHNKWIKKGLENMGIDCSTFILPEAILK